MFSHTCMVDEAETTGRWGGSSLAGCEGLSMGNCADRPTSDDSHKDVSEVNLLSTCVNRRERHMLAACICTYNVLCESTAPICRYEEDSTGMSMVCELAVESKERV